MLIPPGRALVGPSGCSSDSRPARFSRVGPRPRGTRLAAPLVIHNARIACHTAPPEADTILVERGGIVGLGRADTMPIPDSAESLDVGGRTLLPGFVEIHLHGADGRSFMEATREAARAVSEAVARHGVTRLLATTRSATEEHLLAVIDSALPVIADPSGARIRGFHLEGPFVSPDEPDSGDEQAVRPATWEELERLRDHGRGFVQIMTLASEIPGHVSHIRRLRSGPWSRQVVFRWGILASAESDHW